MSIAVDVNSFSGRYGSEEDIGDIIHVNLSIDSTDIITESKEITFLIDVSGSMETSMKEVKSSLLAFRDALVGKSAREMEQLDKYERDVMLREIMGIRVIVFSNEAREVWSGDSPDLFEDVIIGLETEAMTNMGDAFKVCFDKINPEKYTWVIAMTDGNSNKGPCKTANSFQRLITMEKPLNTKIVSLGYGDNFDPEVLNRVGNFVYVENSEMIPVVLGNLAEEIMTSVGFNCVIDIPGKSLPSDLNDDTIIVPDGEDNIEEGKIIVGSRVIETLCSGKSYDYIYLPHGNNVSRRELNKFKKVNIRFTDMITGEEVNVYYPVDYQDRFPENEIRELYFREESKRLIHRLYLAIKKNRVDREIRRIKQMIAKWDDEICDTYKDDIEKMIEEIQINHRKDRSASMTLNYAVGTGYTQYNEGGYVESTLNSTNHYLMSPLFEDDN